MVGKQLCDEEHKCLGEPSGWSWWASTTTFHTLLLHSVNNFMFCENSNPIELCLFGHVPLILAKGQWLVQSSYPTQLYLIHLGKLNCTWLQAQLDCAFKSPHSIRLCWEFVTWHLVTCRHRDKPKGNVLETMGFLASVCSAESPPPRFQAVPLFPPLGTAEQRTSDCPSVVTVFHCCSLNHGQRQLLPGSCFLFQEFGTKTHTDLQK